VKSSLKRLKHGIQADLVKQINILRAQGLELDYVVLLLYLVDRIKHPVKYLKSI